MAAGEEEPDPAWPGAGAEVAVAAAARPEAAAETAAPASGAEDPPAPVGPRKAGH